MKTKLFILFVITQGTIFAGLHVLVEYYIRDFLFSIFMTICIQFMIFILNLFFIEYEREYRIMKYIKKHWENNKN